MEKSTKTSRRIAAHYVYTPQGVLRQGIVSVNSDGVITDVTTSDRVDSLAGVEHYSGMLVPGFINAHSHLELSYLCGAIAQGEGFASFARSMGQVRDRCTDEQRVRAAAFHDARMWSEGVDAVADICNGDSTFALKESSHIKYVNFLELFGLRTVSAEVLAPIAQSSSKYKIPYTVTPHSTYSLNTKAFNEAVSASCGVVPTWCGAVSVLGCVASVADRSLPLSIHFMESRAENELYERRGDLWSWYENMRFEVDFLDFGSAARRIVESIPSSRRIMLIHNTFVGESDVALLQSHFGENLTWVVCPRSNQYIGRAVPPVELLQRSGARIAIGTDSLASNESLSMVEEMKLLTDVPLTTCLRWATLGGAEALGIEREYGSIEVGKKSGLVLLTDLDWKIMQLTEKTASSRIL